MKNCLCCNSEFKPIRRSSKFCSKHCSMSYKYKDNFDLCPICQKKKLKRMKYCSKECYHKSTITLIKLNCESCGKEIMRRKKVNARFCSNQCASNAKDYNLIFEKMKETNIEKYGVDSFSKTNEFKGKINATIEQRYGGRSALIEKSKISLLKNHYDNVILNKYVGYTPMFDIEDYVGTKNIKYQFKHDFCGTEFETFIQDGRHPRCPVCYSKHSIIEDELYDFIISILPNEKIERNNRDILNGKELDVYIPEKSIAIELNGLYWHGENVGNKPKSYHLNKTNDCEKLGITLIQILEDEWMNKREIVKSRLKSILRIISKKVYARNCIIKEIYPKEKSKFLNDNHIQGNDKSSVRLGAFHNDELISVMTFCKPRIALGKRNNKENIYELSRFCSKLNINCVGMASKLLNYFEKEHSPNKIYSYADRRWSIGNVYEACGFKFKHNTGPNYWYIVNNVRYHRFNFRKSVLKEKLNIFNINNTEFENMKNNGHDRVYDCGSKLFEKTKEL